MYSDKLLICRPKVWNAMAAAGVDTLTSNLPPEIHEWLGNQELQSLSDEARERAYQVHVP